MASVCGAGTKVSSDSKFTAKPLDLTIYHLEGRRSERIVWLCEELGIPYKLEYKRGDLAGSMKAIHDVSPLMPVAPTVRIGDQVMVESGAIIELILAREGHGRLEPALAHATIRTICNGCTFAEGSFAARVIADYRVALIQGKPKTPAGGYKLVDTEAVLAFMEDFLSKHPYFGGRAFFGRRHHDAVSDQSHRGIQCGGSFRLSAHHRVAQQTWKADRHTRRCCPSHGPMACRACRSRCPTPRTAARSAQHPPRWLA